MGECPARGSLLREDPNDAALEAASPHCGAQCASEMDLRNCSPVAAPAMGSTEMCTTALLLGALLGTGCAQAADQHVGGGKRFVAKRTLNLRNRQADPEGPRVTARSFGQIHDGPSQRFLDAAEQLLRVLEYARHSRELRHIRGDLLRLQGEITRLRGIVQRPTGVSEYQIG